MKKPAARRLVLLLAVLLWCGWAAASEVQVLGLFKGAALLQIDGKRQLLKEGQQLSSGIRLLSADPNRAILMIDGQRRILQLSDQISATYRSAEQKAVTIPRNLNREYLARVRINGRGISAVVDTGANIVAISAGHAQVLGLAYKNGTLTQVSTAGGMARAYRIFLPSVDLGGMVVHQVPAVVVEGRYPEKVLLGMTFLEHFNMEESNNVLTLQQRY